MRLVDMDLHEYADLPTNEDSDDMHWLEDYMEKTTALGFTVHDPGRLAEWVFEDDDQPVFVRPLTPLSSSSSSSSDSSSDSESN